MGTVLTGDQARAAVDAGAQFLVTPGIRADVAKSAADSRVPVIMGALTPTEVLIALDLGAAAVKIFPAERARAQVLSRTCAGRFPTSR